MKEVTYEDWQKNPTPRMMWVWDNDEDEAMQRKVVYFIEKSISPAVALFSTGMSVGVYKHCAEIEKQRRMTNQELAWWLREKPTRERKWAFDSCVRSVYVYDEKYADEEVDVDMRIREDGGEWREPLVEVEE